MSDTTITPNPAEPAVARNTTVAAIRAEVLLNMVPSKELSFR